MKELKLSHGDIAEMAEEGEQECDESKQTIDEKGFIAAKETGRTIAEDLLEQGVNAVDLAVIGQEIIYVSWEKRKGH